MLLSKNFKNDTLSLNTDLIPIVVFAEYKEEAHRFIPLWAVAPCVVTVQDVFGTRLNTLPILDNFGNTKFSVDWESKKVKINRLRISMYNKFDENTLLTDKGWTQQFEEFDSTLFTDTHYNLEGKYAFVYYKSPTTNVIRMSNPFETLVEDTDCAVVYEGIINRVSFNEAKIKIGIEDVTQDKLAKKEIPFYDVSNMPSYISQGIASQYKELSCPMTFGKVDHAYSMPYLSESEEINIIVDAYS